MLNQLNKHNSFSFKLTPLLLIGFSTLCLAENHPLNIQDLSKIETLQKRVTELTFDTSVSNPYVLNKAKAWLDFALIEYHDRDHTGIVQDATTEADRLLSLTHSPASNADKTPHPAASERVRLDLWEKASVMKQHPEHACADKQLAELEVQLVWTGHEKWESGWSHAAPYAKIAENLAYEAQVSLDKCTAEHAAKTALVADNAAASETKVITIEKRTLTTDTMFTFNRYGVEHLVLGGKQKLNQLVTELNGWKSIEKISLKGYTDRIGSDTYNLTLGQKRADKIKQYLSEHGISNQLIEATGLGEAEPIVACKAQQTNHALIECLQPNRRVEFVIEGAR